MHAENLQLLLERRAAAKEASSSAGAAAQAAAAQGATGAAAAFFPGAEEAAALVRHSLEQTNEAFPAAIARWQEGGWNTTVALWSPRFVCDWCAPHHRPLCVHRVCAAND